MGRTSKIEWSAEMDALIRAQFGVAGCSAVARQLKLRDSTISRRAEKLGIAPPNRRVRPGTCAALTIELSKRPEGVGRKDCAAYGDNLFYRVTRSLVKAGLLFKAEPTHTTARWFACARRAAAWNAGTPGAQATAAPTAPAIKPGPAKPSARIMHCGGPARLPGDPQPTGKTKYTIAPPAPPVVYRTNTHAYH
jgi:hypothetical protein